MLTGFADPCSGSVFFPLGAPSVGLDGNAYVITSPFAIVDPPGCPSLPLPYEVTAELGDVADGHYTVAWIIGPLNVAGAFDVSSGVLQVAASPVPTLTPLALSVLVATMNLAGLALFRRQRFTAVRGTPRGHNPLRS